MRKTLVFFAAVGVLAIGVALALAARPSPVTAQISACGPSTWHLRQSFSLDHAEDYRQHLPAAPVLPELEGNTAPALVAIFDGPLTIPTVTLGDPQTYASAVCVVVNGEPYIYPDLNASGATP
jgi:hypothetical protein